MRLNRQNRSFRGPERPDVITLHFTVEFFEFSLGHGRPPAKLDPYSSIARQSSITFVASDSAIRIKMCGVPPEAGMKKLNAGKSSKSASKSAGKSRLSKRTATDTQTIADLV